MGMDNDQKTSATRARISQASWRVLKIRGKCVTTVPNVFSEAKGLERKPNACAGGARIAHEEDLLFASPEYMHE